MKKLITSIALVLASVVAVAQENYTVKTSMKIEGLPPEYAGFGEQEITNYIKGDKTKTELTSMMMNQTILFDGKLYTFLNEAMGNKTGYTATKEEIEAAASEKTETKPKVEYTSEKKTIAGYECNKAIITAVDKEKKENKITVWVTDKIKYDMSKARKANSNMMDLGDLKGYPLEMEMARSQNGMDMKITLTATDVSTKPIDDAVFTVSTDGYKMSSYKEAMEKMKAMKGNH